jgi:hypothetical protein
MPPELVQLLIELSNALNKHTMYPTGHPMLVTAAEQLSAQLKQMLEQRTALALGISPNQIIAGGIASDPRHAVIRDLAARLHRRNVGALKLSRGVEREELEGMLRFLSTEDRSTEKTEAPGWPHIRMHPLSYSQLELIGDPGAPGGGGGSWATKLWLDLSRAALENEAPAEGTAEPAQVARAMDTREWDETYGQRIAESLTDLLDACRVRGGAEAIALQSRISKVITSVAPETLERLVRMERNEVQRQRFLLEIAQSMAVDAVLDLVQAAATATSRSISPALLQLLGKLAEHSEAGAVETRDRADFAFRSQVRQLIEGWEEWDSRDPAPPDHQRTMEHLSLAGKSPLRGHSSTYECEPERLLMMSLEVGLANASTYSAAAYLINQGRTAQLRELFTRAPHPALATDILRNVASESTLRGLLRSEPLDISALEIIIPLLGETAVAPLLDALVQAEGTERRDPLLRLLHQFGEPAGTEAWARMEDADWPAQRNLLALIIKLPSLPRGFSPAMFIDHPEPRVRAEALRILFRGAGTRARAICEALSAGDPAVVRMAVFASADDCPAAAVPLLIPLIERSDLEPGIRSSAVAAVASVPQALVVDRLIGLCFVGGRWFRRPRIAGKSPVVLAALSGLARHWPNHPRAKAVLELAARHPDEEIRAAVERKSR